jgi:hypothetical protein
MDLAHGQKYRASARTQAQGQRHVYVRRAHIFNIGVESHDDLNDALVNLLQGLAQQGLELPKISWIEM